MSLIDFIILGTLVTGFLVYGLIGKMDTDTEEDYFLAGRDLPWYRIGLSLFSTNFSASALIGITGAAYLTGIAIYNYEWVGVFALIFFIFSLVKVLRRCGIFTIAEYISRRYDRRVMMLHSLFLTFLLIFIDMAAALYAGALLITSIIPELSTSVVIIAIMLLTGVYSIFGGLAAVSKTDTPQSIVTICGAFLIAYFTYNHAGNMGDLIVRLPETSLSLIRPIDDRAVPWTGLLTGIPILCAYYWLTNQNMVQWVLSAKSEGDAQKGILFAGFLKILILFIIVMPGIFASVLFPGITQPDQIYPLMMTQLLPAGALGVVMAGFVAALMSNTDSTLHAASTIITMDFVRNARPNASSKSLVNIGRFIVLIIIIISALWAPNIASFGSLFEYIQSILSYAVTPFVVVYLGGIFWRGASTTGAIATIVIGLSSALVIGLLNSFIAAIDIHYLHIPLPIALICCLSLYFISRLYPSATAPPPELLWENYANTSALSADAPTSLSHQAIANQAITNREIISAEKPNRTTIIAWSLALTALTLVIVFIFR